MKVSKLIFTVIFTNMITGSLAFADDLGITKEDMEDFNNGKIEVFESNVVIDYRSYKVVENEQIEEELINFDYDKILLEEKDFIKNKVKLPASILNFDSDVYVAQPLIFGDRDSIYKGASNDDLGADIGAAFRIVILNN